MRLQEALGMLTAEERVALRARRSIVLDPNKRIDEIEQTTRALVAETDLRHSRLPPDARVLLQRLTAAGGMLPNSVNDPGADTLCEFGIAFRARATSQTSAPATGKRLALQTLVLPSVFLIQMPCTEGEDPRSLRLCLNAVEHDVLGPMVLTVLGRPLAVTGPLALQEIWEILSVPGSLDARISGLPAAEARLLDAIERAGGEVTTSELLAFDQTPGLYRTATGVSVQKRGAPFMLQRRGMLFPLGVDRFVLPSDVSRVIGASRLAERAERRARLVAELRRDDHAPTRARYARDPSLPAVMSLLLLRYWDLGMRDDAAVPRHALRKISERLGEREEVVALYTALVRASGLGRLTAPGGTLPGSMSQLSCCDLGRVLRDTWLRGGVWDETRLEPEVLRGGAADRSSTVSIVARTLALEALHALAADRWVNVDVIVQYALEDPRARGATRMLERAQLERPGLHRTTIDAAIRSVLVESAPALGVVDIAGDQSAVRVAHRVAGSVTGEIAGVLRTSMTVPATCSLQHALALADFAEPDSISVEKGIVVLSLGVTAVARARARGLTSTEVQSRLAPFGLSDVPAAAIRELYAGLETVREAAFIPISGAIIVEDEAARQEILSDPGMRRVLVEAETGNYLLVKSEVGFARIQTRLGRLGIRLQGVEPVARQSSDESGEHSTTTVTVTVTETSPVPRKNRTA